MENETYSPLEPVFILLNKAGNATELAVMYNYLDQARDRLRLIDGVYSIIRNDEFNRLQMLAEGCTEQQIEEMANQEHGE